jgi:hypothetical protein
MKDQTLTGRKNYDRKLGECKYLVAYNLKWWQKILLDGSHKTRTFDTKEAAEEYIQSLFKKQVKSIHYFEKVLSTNYLIK